MWGYKAEVAAAFGPEGETPRYSVCWLATAPGAQRQGLAAALITHVLDRAHAEGNYVTLLTQTKENVSCRGSGRVVDTRWHGTCASGSKSSQLSSFRLRTCRGDTGP